MADAGVVSSSNVQPIGQPATAKPDPTLLRRLTDYWRRVQVAAALESLKNSRDGTDDNDDDGNDEKIIRSQFSYEQFEAGTCPESVYRAAFRRVDAEQRSAYEKALKRNPSLPEPEPRKHISVVFSPFGIQIPGERDLLHVLFGQASVDRSGKMATADVESDLPPIWVGRSSLEPSDGLQDAMFPLADADRYYDEIAAKLRDLQTWPTEWKLVLSACADIWKKSARSAAVPLYDALAKRYPQKPGWIRFEESDSKKLTIIRMYEKLADQIRKNTVPPLYREAALGKHRRVFTTRKAECHLGQMGGDYPLAPSQRDSLLAYLQTPIGCITAINGPPGTGKTTLLQSVVATEMVERAVAQAEAPLYIAGAATNQAVANIIKAFREATDGLDHPLADRWIPGVGRRYGVYFRAAKGESVNLARGSLICSPSNFNHHGDYDASGIARLVEDIERRTADKEEVPIDLFFAICESDEIKNRFLAVASSKLGERIDSLPICIDELHSRLTSVKREIVDYCRASERLLLTMAMLTVAEQQTIGAASDVLEDRVRIATQNFAKTKVLADRERMADRASEAEARQEEDDDLKRLDATFEEREVERTAPETSVLEDLQMRSDVIDGIRAKYVGLAAPTTIGEWFGEMLPWRRNAIAAGLSALVLSAEDRGLGTFDGRGIGAMRNWITFILDKNRSVREQIRKIKNLQAEKLEAYRAERKILEQPIRQARVERSRIRDQRESARVADLRNAHTIVEKASEAPNALLATYEEFSTTCERITGEIPPTLLADIPGMIDTTLRVKAFLLATHYWEARFIAEVKSTGWRSQANREHAFRKMAMLTPCFVSTFDKMGTSYNIMRGDVVSPMWGFADTLIIDEAGQASPDKGAFAFSLAKKALVVGDNLQLPPVNSTDAGSILTSLARSAGILGNDAVLDRGMLTGKVGTQTASGSLMRMASDAAFFDMNAWSRGMWLRDHFRCDPRIMDFCNRIWYTGDKSLVARRKQPEDSFVPHFGHMNVVGKSQNGSNEAEALAIVRWIDLYGVELQKHYNNVPLHKIVAVLTPFGNQRRLLRALRDRRYDWRPQYENPKDIVMGTVHALQGEERPVVLFSTVYDAPRATYFFDSEHTMLNVAVSRAKDAFIVFGNRRLFQAETLDFNKPSTYLRVHLFDESLADVPPLPNIP